MDYTSHTSGDLETILGVIGVSSVEELLNRIIPGELRLGRPLDLPDCAPEATLTREFSSLAGENEPAAEKACFLGGGVYDHYTPAAISSIVNRSEFSTAYTPYQAEVAQGTLQTIYEFQTMIARLMGMDAANASHYDGATALAEGVLLAVRRTGKKAAVLPHGLNPMFRDVLLAYCKPAGIELKVLEVGEGTINLDFLRDSVGGAGAVVVQQPNFFGLLEPAEETTKIAHESGAMIVSSTYPMTLGLLKPPGEWGADIATAEGQAFGVPMSFGGPYLGLFAVKSGLIRQMPGRLVARAQDRNGKGGFVLTLQTREQHIRREKATSNICTNQALVALSGLVYLSLVGRDGLRRIATDSYRRAHYLADGLEKIKGCSLRFGGKFFNEFVLDLPVNAIDVRNMLLEQDIFAGPALGSFFEGMDKCLLVAVTEKRTKADLDRFTDVLNQLLKQ